MKLNTITKDCPKGKEYHSGCVGSVASHILTSGPIRNRKLISRILMRYKLFLIHMHL